MEPILALSHVQYTIEQKQILKDISLVIQPGEQVMITGPSGSGKSTLLKIIATILSKTAGDIQYLGKEMEDYEPTAYRKDVSYCFQTASLFGKNVQENLAFPFIIRNLPFNQEKAVDALQSVGLDNTYLTKKIEELSGGEKQRIALIRNLLFLPKVLLLDEITSALDEENRKIIQALIKKANQEQHVTILWITHNEEETSLGNRLIQITDGEMEEIR